MDRTRAQIPASDGSKRLAYQLTQKGRALLPVLKAIREWGLTWMKETKVLVEITKSKAKK